MIDPAPRSHGFLSGHTGRVTTWDGDEYQARFDELAASGTDVHGEATFVRAYSPRSVLDAGCGTGRVAIELARHGIDVVGVDVDASMLATAAERGPAVEWVEADLTALDLGLAFDIVVMAGNVPLFTTPGTQAALVAHVAAHVGPGGRLIAGFQHDWSGREYTVDAYDAALDDAGMEVAERFSTWGREPWTPGSTYSVTVSTRADP